MPPIDDVQNKDLEPHGERIVNLTHEEAANDLRDLIERNTILAQALNAGLTYMSHLYRKWATVEPNERLEHGAIDRHRVELARACRQLRDQPDLFIDSWPSKHHGTL